MKSNPLIESLKLVTLDLLVNLLTLQLLLQKSHRNGWSYCFGFQSIAGRGWISIQ